MRAVSKQWFRRRRRCGSGSTASSRLLTRSAISSATPSSRAHHDRRIMRHLYLAPGGRRGPGRDPAARTRPRGPEPTLAGLASSRSARPLPTPPTLLPPIGAASAALRRAELREALFIEHRLNDDEHRSRRQRPRSRHRLSDARPLAATSSVAECGRSFVVAMSSRAPFRRDLDGLDDGIFACSAEHSSHSEQLPRWRRTGSRPADGREGAVEASRHVSRK